MRDIAPGVVDNIVTNVNTFLAQLGRYAATPDQERDAEDSGLIRQVRIAAVSLTAAVETAGRLPAGGGMASSMGMTPMSAPGPQLTQPTQPTPGPAPSMRTPH